MRLFMNKKITNVCLAIALIIPVQSFASCPALQGKQLSDIPAIECSGFDGTAKTACTSGNQTGGAITNCILNGEDPPVAIRPNYGLGTPQVNQVTNTGKCPPPLQAKTTANSSTLDSLGNVINNLVAPTQAEQGGGCQINDVNNSNNPQTISDQNNLLKTPIINTSGNFIKDTSGNLVTNPAVLNPPPNASSGTVTDAMGNPINTPPVPLALNPNIDISLTPAYCLTPSTAAINTVTAPIKCGGAIPTLRKFDPINVDFCNIVINLATCQNGTNVNACGCLVVGNVIQLSGNVDIGNFLYDSDAQDLAQTTRVVNNSLVNNLTPNCSSNVSPYSTNNNTIFQIAGDRTSLVVPPSTTQLNIIDSNYTYKPVGGNIHLPYGDAASLFINGQSITRIPEGGSIISPEGDEIKIPSPVEGYTPTLVSYGNGQVIIPLGGTGSIGNMTTAVDGYNNQATKNGQPTVSASNVSEYVQQTNDVPGYLWNWVMNYSGWSVDGNGCPSQSGSGLIPPPSVPVLWHTYSCHCGLFSCDTCCTIDDVQLTGQYLNYSGLKTATIYATSITSSSNAKIPTRNISAPANSFLSLPSGTPADFSISQAGSITLPAGGSFLVPGSTTTGGATIKTPDGTFYTLNCPACATISINVAQNSQLVSNGGGTVVLPNDTTYSMPNSSTYTLDLSGANNLANTSIPSNVLAVGTQITLPANTTLPAGISSSNNATAIITTGNIGTPAGAATGSTTTNSGALANNVATPTIITATGGNFTLPVGTIIRTPDNVSNTLPIPAILNIPANTQITVSPNNVTFTLSNPVSYTVTDTDTAIPATYDVPLPAGAVLPSGTIITFPTGTNYVNIITNQIGVPAGTSIAVETDVTNNNSLVLPPQSPASDPQSPNPSCSR